MAVSTGCRTTPKVTKLPGSDNTQASTSSSKTSSLPDGSRVTPPSGVTGVTGSDVTSSELPNEDKLTGRDVDRAAFAAQTVYFEYDRANVRATEAAKLNEVATAFKARGADHDLLIEGHCDERGTEEYNRALGDRRALALRELLIQAGVDGGRVFTRSFGKDSPANPGHDETAWSRNRRGEFILVLPEKITTTQNTQ